MERRREVERGELTVPVVSPEDLVVLKILAARPHDYEDLRAVIRGVGAALDKKRVTETLTIWSTRSGRVTSFPRSRSFSAQSVGPLRAR